MTDPDPDDTASLVSCDFGLASNFIIGKYPSYKVVPISNSSHPGEYEVKVTL